MERNGEIRERLKTAYNERAAERDAEEIPAWKAAERERFLAALRRAEAPARGGAAAVWLLEIGAGPGRDALFFREAGLDVTAVDLSPEMVRLCRAKGLRALEMDAAELRFPDGSFYAVYAMNSLLHIPKAELPGVLAEIRRVLRPGGLFYMGVYGGIDTEGVWENDPYTPKRFFAMYTDEALRRAAGGGFEVGYFGVVEYAGAGAKPYFQSMLLRKGAG